MKLLLQHKIVTGYLLLMAIIGCMVAIVSHERKRVAEIEQESISIFQTQSNISTAHRHITVLTTFGESVMTWTRKDCESYHIRRLKADSLVQVLRKQCKEFVRPEQVDSLRSLLFNKEEHLLRMNEIFLEQKHIDILLANQYSFVTSQASDPRTVIRKKKGIAGFFGGKETIHLPPVTTKMKARGNELISLQEERRRNLETYTDSLRLYNRELNRKLLTLITSLDEQALFALQNKEIRLKDSYEHSTHIITCLIIFSIILLIVSYLIIQRDIREKARNKERMEETIEQNTALLEMRKNIILTISHDIRAPLNIISGSAELAMDTHDKKRRNNHLNNIRIICKHVVHLLNNLLDVYRMNEAKETRNDVPFSLNNLLERIASGFSHIVTNKGILFRPNFKDTDVNLYGDVDRIEQIMDNLLTNAVKFTESGNIVLNACYHKEILILEVKDSGIGMSPETLSRIFRPFERLTSATNVDGVGLGLSITKGLVSLLGGTIEVASDLGKGTTFRVSLPLPETTETVEEETAGKETPLNLPRHVLVIDDDPMQLEVIREMLERNGVSCMTCTTAAEVVREMRKQGYDMLLTDIQMPGTNGFALLELLRKSNIRNSRTVPVIAMTARGDNEKDALLGSGFTGCIFKPFSTAELLKCLSSLTDTSPASGLTDFTPLISEVSDQCAVLEKLIESSRRDMEDLRQAMETDDRKQLRETVHRMWPLWELLQKETRLGAYRELLKDKDAACEVIRRHTESMIGEIENLIIQSGNEIRTIQSEEQDTDSGR